MTNVVHENENYKVVIDRDVEIVQGGFKLIGGYAIINKGSGIREYVSPAMPEALFASEQLNHALLSKGWEWRKETPPPTELNPELLVN